MIQDASFVFNLDAPGGGVIAAASTGYDLNPDYGSGQYARKAPLIGVGEDFCVRVDVTNAFVQMGIGVPVFQFHMALSDLPSMLSANMVIIGSSMPSQTLVAQTPDIQIGWNITQLTLGAQFYIRCNPWTAPMGRSAAGAALIGKDLRYLGLICVQPNYHVADTFAEGSVDARFVKHSDTYSWKDHAYPSAVKHVG